MTPRTQIVSFGVASLLAAAGLGAWISSAFMHRTGGTAAPRAAAVTVPAHPASSDNSVYSANTVVLPYKQQLILASEAALGTPGAKVQEEKTITPVKLLRLPFGAVLLTTTTFEGSHADAGSMDIYYLRQTADGFKVLKRWADEISGDAFGAAPRWSLSTKFSDYLTIYQEGGYGGQGCTSGSATLTELTPAGPVQTAHFNTEYSNTGLPDDNGSYPAAVASTSGKIVNIQQNRSFDVIYTGAESFTHHWLRHGNTFHQQNGHAALDGC